MANLHQLVNIALYVVRQHALQHGDRIVTIDYYDVTSPCVQCKNFKDATHFGRRWRR